MNEITITTKYHISNANMGFYGSVKGVSYLLMRAYAKARIYITIINLVDFTQKYMH